MLPCMILLSLVLLLRSINHTKCVTKEDFYDFSAATAFNGSEVKLTSGIPYPHWSDESNTLIHITSSGIARLSGFFAENTLDVLIYATASPLSFKTVFYEQITPTATLQEKLKIDFAKPDFIAKHVTIATWSNTQFSFDTISSFQMIFATDANVTYLMLQIDRIDHDNLLPYFPEVDLRYSYDGGTKFTRVDFLKSATGVSTRTALTASAATEQSNCGRAGRWILKVTDDPLATNRSENTTTRRPPTRPGSLQRFNNKSGISLQGKFTFTTLSMDNNLLTSTGNNDELNIILTKRASDQRFGILDTNVKAMINRVYKKATDSTESQVNILSYRPGSLIVEYNAQMNNRGICNTTTATLCLDEIKKKVAIEAGNGTLSSGELSGEIDQQKIEVQDFDECSLSTTCDTNAICKDIPMTLSYGCSCKDGYIGDGFPGNCVPIKSKYNYLTITMYLTIFVVVLSVSFVLGVSYKVHRKEKLEEENHMRGYIAKTNAWKNSRRLPPLWYNPPSNGYGSDAFHRRRFTEYE